MQQPANITLPPIINGLWQIADMERLGPMVQLEDVKASIQQYIEAGMSAFDMADHYGSAELLMGLFHSSTDQRERVQLLTKWVPPPGKSGREAVVEAIQTARERLQVHQIDLLQYHAWNYADPIWIDHLFWLNELREDGLIRHLGLTNVDAFHLKMILDTGIPIATNQISYSLLDRRAQFLMEKVCLRYDVRLLAFGTLAGGFLTDRWIAQEEPSIGNLATWSQMKYKRYIDQVSDWKTFQQVLEELRLMADAHDMSLANLAAGYILNRPAVSSVIVGIRPGESEHINDNLKLIQQNVPKGLWKQVDEILDVWNPLPGHCGDEYRKPPYLTAAGDLSDHLDQLPSPYEVSIGPNHRERIGTGTIWEGLAGYSRAVKQDGRIVISGTTATHQDQVIGGRDPASQTHFIIDKITGVLQSFGADLSHVIRTRIFIKDKQHWEPVARAHGLRFGDVLPANTLVQADLIGDEYLVEIEAEAAL